MAKEYYDDIVIYSAYVAKLLIRQGCEMRQAVPNSAEPSRDVFYFIKNPRTQKIANLLLKQNEEEKNKILNTKQNSNWIRFKLNLF